MVYSLPKEVRASVVENELASWGYCELGKEGAVASQRHVTKRHRVTVSSCHLRLGASNTATSVNARRDAVGSVQDRYLLSRPCYLFDDLDRGSGRT